MIRINQIKLPITHNKEQIKQKAAKILKVKPEEIKDIQIVKKSVDARKKPDIFYVYTIDVKVCNEEKIIKRKKDTSITISKTDTYEPPLHGTEPLKTPPVIVGAGPAGLFAAYLLAKEGYCPIVIERGKKVTERTKDVLNFWETGVLNPRSNVQFGEGGAGTFSDGKLNTLVKDSFGRNQFVLKTFVKFGASENICFEQKPHIGTDILSSVVEAMRNEIIRLGGTFAFETCMTNLNLSGNAIKSITLNGERELLTNVCILAIGHSARDTFEMLSKTPLLMQAKSFAVGFRVEHPQNFINECMYGVPCSKELGAAPYKVTANLSNQRSVYSFCMCPGGYVVNASSEEQHLAVNGMSYSKRNGKNANSAVIVSVTPLDFDGTDALAGMRFQRKLEQKAYELGHGKIPQQQFGDYCANRVSVSYGAFSTETKGAATLTNLRGLLTEEMETSFIEGMHHFARQIPGFDREDAILSGIESRTSSPIRIVREKDFLSNIEGIYPCGEGAGYAGGITSAAMDGLKVAEAVIKKYRPFNRIQ